MAGPLNRKGSALSEINVTPLVDVMLVLLIIFMVTAPLLKQGISVELPQGAPRDIDVDESYVISITDKSEYYFNQDLVTLPELERRLRIFNERGFLKIVFLRADKTVPYGVVVAAMDVIKKAGVEQLGIVTEPYD
ncbi:ExbD/TolR family protein [candidate division CSSED10-310 bacterium]|uniref:ExbD/TolR family protein n=1 Tax=candidate division CSSED10-310 bacterium TaxID=2855610 RepID=A0ABV6YUV5_UNCC1